MPSPDSSLHPLAFALDSVIFPVETFEVQPEVNVDAPTEPVATTANKQPTPNATDIVGQ